jgi:hypothetical protein
MAKFALSWDAHRPLLVEVLTAGAWTDEDHSDYLAGLKALLAQAPVDGFDLLSDSLDYTMQVDAEADHVAYDLLAEAGCRRMLMVATKMSIIMQTQRMIRESAIGQRIEFVHVMTTAEADQVLSDWHPAGSY